MEHILTIDIGTSSAKTALISRSGEVLAKHSASYETISQRRRIEQNPEDWWKAVKEGILAVNPRIDEQHFCGIILGGQMQDLIMLGSEGLVAPAILYSDSRAQNEIREIEKILGSDRLKETTGNLQDASSLLAKLLWLKTHEAERYKALDTILLGAHDYIAWKLTGRKHSDFTTATTTGLLDIRKNDWAEELMGNIGLRTDILPQLVPAAHKDGQIQSEIAESLGLPVDSPVFHGSGDVGTATLGANAGEPGTTSCYLGTSGWLASTTENVLNDPEHGLFNLRHPDPDKIIQVGPMLLAAGNIQWIVEQISCFSEKDNSYTLLNECAAAVNPGANGILYLPYLSGERSPFRAPEARGGFLGLSRETSREELYRAALEGVAFAMRSIQESISGPEIMLKSLTLSGGGAKSCLWAQIFADIFQCEVLVLENAEDVGSIGAAVICGKALGWYADYHLPAEFLKVEKRYIPQEKHKQLYDGLYAVFRRLYPGLMESWSALQTFREKYA